MSNPSPSRFLIVTLLAVVAAPTAALADDDVPAVTEAPDGQLAVQRGIQVPKGMVTVRATLAMNLSVDQVGEPISLAPDLYFGVSDRLQIGVVHDGPMRWQARPGGGLCLTGTDHGCASLYDNVGVDVMYGLMYGDQVHASVHGGLFLASFDPTTTFVAVGLTAKVHLGHDAAITFDPQLGIAVSDRDANDDALFLPIDVSFQLGAMTTLKLLTGVVGGLDQFRDGYQIPVGVGMVRNLTEDVDVGARLSFDNLLGAQADGVNATDTRSLALLLNYRR